MNFGEIKGILRETLYHYNLVLGCGAGEDVETEDDSLGASMADRTMVEDIGVCCHKPRDVPCRSLSYQGVSNRAVLGRGGARQTMRRLG